MPPISKDELLELYKTRAWLEETALRESMSHGGADWEEAMVLAYHRLSKTPRCDSETGSANPYWEDRHREFHESLIAACGSSWMLRFCGMLHDHADRYRQVALAAPGMDRDSLAEHEAIKDAAVAGDADRAVACLMEHYDKTKNIILGAGLLD